MKDDLGSVLRRLLPPSQSGGSGGGGREPARTSEADDLLQDIAEEFTLDELREFLEADLLPVEADPGFRERLREGLWKMVQDRYGAAAEGPPED